MKRTRTEVAITITSPGYSILKMTPIGGVCPFLLVRKGSVPRIAFIPVKRFVKFTFPKGGRSIRLNVPQVALKWTELAETAKFIAEMFQKKDLIKKPIERIRACHECSRSFWMSREGHRCQDCGRVFCPSCGKKHFSRRDARKVS